MKVSIALLVLSSSFQQIHAQDTVYAAYIFHRHGDRTAKSLPPVNLTSLGYQQILSSGNYYHDRYVESSSPAHIAGLSSTIVKNSQIAVTAPLDTVLQNSASGFLQGLYPPVGSQTQTLGNGTIIQAPMDGFQLIPVSITSAGGNSENNGWLQDASGCYNAKISSNSYFQSAEYKSLNQSSYSFYQSLLPIVNRTYTSSFMTYLNAYLIFDLINVARIDNVTVQSASLLDAPTTLELQLLANTHEFGLAYNSTDRTRAVQGMQLAGEILTYLNASIASKGTSGKLGIQFGAYGTFLSYFGLANLTAVNADFTGIPDYASSMAIEVFGPSSSASSSANGTAAAYPDASALSVRFFFSNGSTGEFGAPRQYPVFGNGAMTMPWSEFAAQMKQISITNTEQWCGICGNTTGSCAPYAPNSSSGPSSGTGATSAQGTSHMSLVVAGVIGAVVTLAVVLGLQALLFAIAGLRLVRKGASKKSVNGEASPRLKA